MFIMWYMLRIVHIKTTTKRGVFQPHFLRISRKRLGSTSAGVGNSFRSRLFFVLSRLITVVCGRLHHIINIMWYRGGDAVTLTEYAAAEQRPELLTQWDAARNGALTPDDVSPGSEKRVWWRQRPPMAEHNRLPGAAGHRLPLLHRQAPHPGRNRPADKAPGAGGAVASHKKRRPDAPGCDRRQHAPRLVAVRQGALVAGGGVLPGGGHRLSLLHRQAGAAGLQRPRHPVSGYRGRVAPHAQRRPDAQQRHQRLQEAGLVAVPGRSRLEGVHFFPHPGKGDELPDLRRQNASRHRPDGGTKHTTAARTGGKTIINTRRNRHEDEELDAQRGLHAG